MKKLISLLVIFAAIETFSLPSFAVTVPEFVITSNNYAAGDRIVYEETKDIEVGSVLQLYAVTEFGNEMGETPSENGWFVKEVLSGGVTWSTSDACVASVDENGKVLGVSEGKAVITASLDPDAVSYDVPVTENSFEIEIRPYVFRDVPADAYFRDAVSWAVENKITSGTSETTFSPDDGCTRGQVVTFLWRLAGSPEPGVTENPFSDVGESDYFFKAVLWAVGGKITVGTGNKTFSPGEVCTRGQIVTFFYRSKGSPAPSGPRNPFADVKKDDYFFDAVLWAAENEITLGTTDASFAPGDTCTRAQVVTFMFRGVGVHKAFEEWSGEGNVLSSLKLKFRSVDDIPLGLYLMDKHTLDMIAEIQKEDGGRYRTEKEREESVFGAFRSSILGADRIAVPFLDGKELAADGEKNDNVGIVLSGACERPWIVFRCGGVTVLFTYLDGGIAAEAKENGVPWLIERLDPRALNVGNVEEQRERFREEGYGTLANVTAEEREITFDGRTVKALAIGHVSGGGEPVTVVFVISGNVLFEISGTVGDVDAVIGRLTVGEHELR
ncbi:MAG: S-layer homology domain-containing protein [Clostridia bacterium]|nr:S-layer homology domain-containing protein [Clostridia bacterium]